MRRKTIQLAGKTLVVSLPNRWVKEWGVGKGDELEITEEGPSITVKTDKQKQISTAEIDIRELSERVIRWELSSLHKKGYEEIEIWYKGEQEKLIKELLKDLFTGFMIIDKTENRIKIQTISKDDKQTYNQVLRRTFLNTLDLAESLTKYLDDGADIEELLELEKVNNKLTNFCQRLLNKYGHEDPCNTTFMYVILWNLEKIADDYKYIIKEIGTKELKKEIIELLKETSQLLRSYYEIFYKFNSEELNKQANKGKELQQKIKEQMQSEDAVILAHISHTVQKIVDFSASTVAINCKS